MEAVVQEQGCIGIPTETKEMCGIDNVSRSSETFTGMAEDQEAMRMPGVDYIVGVGNQGYFNTKPSKKMRIGMTQLFIYVRSSSKRRC